jgi:hypothetical protein
MLACHTSPLYCYVIVHTVHVSIHTVHLSCMYCHVLRPTVPCVASIQCHVSSPRDATCLASIDFLLVLPKFHNTLTSSYNVCLIPLKHRWKDLVELFTMESFSSTFKNIKFSVTKSTWITNVYLSHIILSVQMETDLTHLSPHNLEGKGTRLCDAPHRKMW